MKNDGFGRRGFIAAGAAAMTAMATPLRAEFTGEIEGERSIRERVDRNAMSFQSVDWRDHFDTLQPHGAILTDIDSRALHFWSADEETYLLYPCSVPMAEEFERRGDTEIVLKRRDPVWIPTPNMRERDPELPERVEPGPENPMGTRALNLTWTHYRIHGIDDVRKIGRKASNGCFGLYNHQVEELFERVEVGTRVRVI